MAQALVHRPPVIVLDEPTAGVDVELRQTLWKFIEGLNRDGHTIVLTTHYLEEAESLCGRIAMLQAGRVVALDTTADLLRRHAGAFLRVKIGGALPAELAARNPAQAGGSYRFRLNNYDEVDTVLAPLRAGGVHIEELEVLAPDLEDVFIQVMNQGKESAP